MSIGLIGIKVSRSRRPFPLSDVQVRILRRIQDAPLAWSGASDRDFRNLRTLVRRGFLSYSGGEWALTLAGRARLEESTA